MIAFSLALPRHKRKEKSYRTICAKSIFHPTVLLLLVIAGLVGAHFGKFIIVALYYICFQTHIFDWLVHLFGSPQTMKEYWDSLLSQHIPLLSTDHWDHWRHIVRNVGEGLLGGAVGQIFAFNAYKKANRAKIDSDPNLLGRTMDKLHIPRLGGPRIGLANLFLFPLWIVLFAIPGLAIGAAVFAAILHVGDHTVALGPGASYWQVVRDELWSSNWDQIVIGLLGSFVIARKVILKYAADIQLYFAERWVYSGSTPQRLRAAWSGSSFAENGPLYKRRSRVQRLWDALTEKETAHVAEVGRYRPYHLHNFRARCEEVIERREKGEDRRSNLGGSGLVGIGMVVLVMVGVGLAAYGYYILTVIAAHH